MKHLIYILLFFLCACTELIDKPKDVIEKEVMAEMIADFAINEQLMGMSDNYNLDNATRFTMKKYKVTSAAYADSYRYYTATGDMDKILKRAQKIIIKRDPQAGQYIEEQIAEEKRKEKERQEKEKKEQEKARSGETKN